MLKIEGVIGLSKFKISVNDWYFYPTYEALKPAKEY